MRTKDTLTFTVMSIDAVFGWDLELELSRDPKTKDALAKITSVIGIAGIENFINYAMEGQQTIEILIDDDYNNHHSLEFDPYSAPKSDDPKYDSEYVLFVKMLEACLTEFIKKAKDANGKPSA